METADNKNYSAGVRLNKYLSLSGVCSRRQADVLIENGEVFINGRAAVLGARVYPGDKVEYNGSAVFPEEKLILLAFNKPRGTECTTDKSNPDNIIDLINYESRVFPIGRLDKDSSGLILLTNKGDLSDKISRGSNLHEKEYEVRVDKPLTKEFLKTMSAGVPILDTVTRPCRVTQTGKNSFNIILTQGLNRQIRRMCEYCGYYVTDLKRVRIMNITLGNLRTGTYRNIEGKELERLLKELYKDGSDQPDKRTC